MRTLRSVRIAGVALTMITMAGVSACSQGSGTEEEASWAGADPSEASGTVTFWSWGDAPDIVNAAVAEFNEVYPDIEVSAKVVSYKDYVSALGAALASGEGPDTFNLEPAMAQQFTDFTEDLVPLYEAQVGADWRSSVSTVAVDELTVDDRLVAAPNSLSVAGTLQLNVGLLDELGLEFPTGSVAPDELARFCESVRQAGKACISIGAKDGWVSQDVFQAVASSVAPGAFAAAVEGGDWTAPGLEASLDIWQSFFTDGVFQDGALGVSQYPDAWNAWLRGEAVATPVGSWGATDFITATNLNNQSGAGVSDPTPLQTVLVPFPAVGGDPTTLAASVGSGTAINVDSENKAAAAAWVNWYSTDPAGYQKFGADTLVGPASITGVEATPGDVAYPELVEDSLALLASTAAQEAEPRAIPYPEVVTALAAALQSSATGESSSTVLETLQAASDGITRG
ncbi:ABC-type glycerol-3-phosphate transport system, substrate-binding protein [Jiangella sp. DSM 45060]|nr:ABC-type glycerol-3-phosphate transport system, substrate-binding protein [Jiangella sp. DSM 45060]